MLQKFSEYYADKRYLDGYRKHCKQCHKEIARQYYIDNYEHMREYRVIRYKKFKERKLAQIK